MIYIVNNINKLIINFNYTQYVTKFTTSNSILIKNNEVENNS